jgi:hypothetical protein
VVKPSNDLGVSTMEWIKQNKGFLALIIFSLIWCSGALYLLSSEIYFDIFYLDMNLNELGDYLAGVFSPLAFLWLIYGYFKQNSELRLNRKSLENQIEEFKKSVSISKQNIDHLVKKNKQDILIEIEKLQPVFSVVKLSSVIESSSKDKPDGLFFTLTLNVKNQMAKSIYILSKNDGMESIGTKNINETFSVEIYFEKDEVMVGEKNNSFKLFYDDIRDVNREVNINCTPHYHQVSRYSFDVDIQKLSLVNYEH